MSNILGSEIFDQLLTSSLLLSIQSVLTSNRPGLNYKYKEHGHCQPTKSNKWTDILCQVDTSHFKMVGLLL